MNYWCFYDTLFKYFQAPDEYGLILLDIVMPEKDGLEVLAELKADEDLKQIPVVMLSGISDEDIGPFLFGVSCVFWMKKYFF